MGRKKKTIDRGITPDTKYNSVVLAKFVNRMMWEGKRSVGMRVVHEALGILQEKAGKEPLEVFLKAIDNVKPVIEVKSRRVGGATYQVPVEIRETRREALGMRWIITAARARSGHGPLSRRRSVPAVFERESELAFRRTKMRRCNGGQLSEMSAVY